MTVTVNVADPFAYNLNNGSNHGYTYGIDQDDAGNFWCTGYKYNGTDGEAMLSKYDIEGTHLWTRTYGTTTEYGYFWDSVPMSDGGVIAVGYTREYGPSSGSYYAAWVVRISATGTVLWSKAYGRSGYHSYAYDVTETDDGNYALIGRVYGYGSNPSQANILLSKFTDSGSFLWHKSIGGTDYEYGSQVIASETGGYLLTGYEKSYGPGATSYYNMFLVKLDSAGDHVWSRAIGSSSQHDYGLGVVLGSDGYYIAGYSNAYGPSAPTYTSGFLVKLSYTGTLIGARGIGGTSYDYFRSISYTDEDNVVMFGYTRSFGAGVPLDDNSMWIVELNSSFGLVGSQAMGCTGDKTQIAYEGIYTNGGGYAVTGYTNCYGLPTSVAFIAGLDSDMTPCIAGDTSAPTISSASPTVQSYTPAIENISPTVVTPTVPVISTSDTWTDRCP